MDLQNLPKMSVSDLRELFAMDWEMYEDDRLSTMSADDFEWMATMRRVEDGFDQMTHLKNGDDWSLVISFMPSADRINKLCSFIEDNRELLED